MQHLDLYSTTWSEDIFMNRVKCEQQPALANSDSGVEVLICKLSMRKG